MSSQEVVVVTGAASGIGRSTAILAHERGWRVTAVDRDADRLEELGLDGVEVIAGDVADPSTWERVVEVNETRHGRPARAFVSNAAIVEVGTVEELADETWTRVLEVNLMGAVRGTRALLPGMRSLGGGSVVTIASTDAFLAEQGLIAYCTSKGALLQFTRALAVDHAREGIRANCVCPGVTDTPLFRYHLSHADDPDAVLETRLARQPQGELLQPEQIAETVVFLLSDASAGMTGALVPVDGGLSTSFEFRL